MKLLTGFFLFLAISVTLALPAGNPDDDAEIVPVSRKQQTSRHDYDTDTDPDFNDFKGVVDTGSGYPFFSIRPYNPIGTGFFGSFEETFRRLRESLWNRWWPELPNPSEGNTTSVVKIVDGHRVEINDTVYTKADDAGNSIFKVRVVNIRPLDSSEENTEGVTEDKSISNNVETDKGSPEEIEKGPEDNEILRNIDSSEYTTAPASALAHPHSSFTTEKNLIIKRSKKLQMQPYNAVQAENKINGQLNATIVEDATVAATTTFTETDSSEAIGSITNTNELIPGQSFENIDINIPLNLNTNNDDEDEKIRMMKFEYSPLNLQSTLNVKSTNNKRESTLEESSEEEENLNENHKWENVNSEWGLISHSDHDSDNTIDAYESVFVDLSNDIAINDAAAAQGVSINPDADIFSVNSFMPEYDRNRYHYRPVVAATEAPVADTKFIPFPLK